METTEVRAEGPLAGLLAGLNDSLHTMSQPMMVLLCSLEYAAGLESLDDMKQAIGFGTGACARLSDTIRAMQTQVRQGLEQQVRAGRSQRQNVGASATGPEQPLRLRSFESGELRSGDDLRSG